MCKAASGSSTLDMARGIVDCEDGTTDTAKAILKTNLVLPSDKTFAYCDKQLDIDKGETEGFSTSRAIGSLKRMQPHYAPFELNPLLQEDKEIKGCFKLRKIKKEAIQEAKEVDT